MRLQDQIYKTKYIQRTLASTTTYPSISSLPIQVTIFIGLCFHLF
jgi:hypothetical protein